MGVGALALRPTAAHADIASIKKALSEQKSVRAITVDSKRRVVREALLVEGRFGVVKDGKVLWKAPQQSGPSQVRVAVGKPLTPGVEEMLDINPPPPLRVELSEIVVEGYPLEDEPDVELVEVPLAVNVSERKVLIADKRTNLPLRMELRRLVGSKWQPVMTTRFEYGKAKA